MSSAVTTEGARPRGRIICPSRLAVPIWTVLEPSNHQEYSTNVSTKKHYFVTPLLEEAGSQSSGEAPPKRPLQTCHRVATKLGGFKGKQKGNRGKRRQPRREEVAGKHPLNGHCKRATMYRLLPRGGYCCATARSEEPHSLVLRTAFDAGGGTCAPSGAPAQLIA